MPQSLNEARIYALFFQTIAGGIHLVIYAQCLLCLLTQPPHYHFRRLSEINWPMVAVATALCVIGVGGGLGLAFYHNYKAFILYKGPGGPAAEFSNISEWINPARVTLVSVQALIGDGMMIYRCWVLNNRSWVVVAAPILMWWGVVACTIRMTQLESSIHTQALVLNEAIEPYATAFWSLTTALNVITNYLIVRRIWKVNSRLRRGGGDKVSGGVGLRQVMRTIIESGLLCTISALFTLAVYVSHSTLIYVTTGLEVQILGIAFDLIIIRVANAQQAVRVDTSHMSQSIQFARTLPGSLNQTVVRGGLGGGDLREGGGRQPQRYQQHQHQHRNRDFDADVYSNGELSLKSMG